MTYKIVIPTIILTTWTEMANERESLVRIKDEDLKLMEGHFAIDDVTAFNKIIKERALLPEERSEYLASFTVQSIEVAVVAAVLLAQNIDQLLNFAEKFGDAPRVVKTLKIISDANEAVEAIRFVSAKGAEKMGELTEGQKEKLILLN